MHNGNYIWAKIEYNGNTGWVAANHLRKSNPYKDQIFGQGHAYVGKKKYGNYTIDYNGCGLIAIYR